MPGPETTHYQLRPATAADRAFQHRLYGTTREEEIHRAGLPMEQAAAFVSHQFEAQTTHYTKHHPDAEWSIIEVDGEPAGRLILDRTPDELNVMDIALLPSFRGRGLGTRILKAVLKEAANTQRSVGLFAYTGERAIGLYKRLGFTPVQENPVHTELKWRPK